MKNVLVVFTYQWGYNTDYLFYCKLLSKHYNVTYIGYDLNLPPVPSDGVRLIEIPFTGKLTKLEFLKAVYKETKATSYTNILVNYFIFSSIISLFSKRAALNVDIRTSYILPSKLKTRIFNTLLKAELKLFKHVSVISQGVKDYLKLPAIAHILPLGGPIFPSVDRDFSSLNFFYVGTFFDRNIPVTIKAFHKFYLSHGAQIPMRYTIVGSGSDEDINNIQTLIRDLSLEGVVSYEGAVRYPELNGYFDTHNVGISYVPMTPYYDCQPPTKTFEYLLSGMAVLATNTTENRRVIVDSNGVVVGDTVDDFYAGMVSIFLKKDTYVSQQIQVNAGKYSWESIVEQNLVPYLEDIASV